jgi:membrane-anchored glycerophosphoryl diester phosphodiesterase (GDPDase)
MKNIFKEFFFSKGKFKPPYFWITVFLFLIVVMFILKLCGVETISDKLILGCLGFVIAWVGIYTWYDKNKPAISPNILSRIAEAATPEPRQEHPRHDTDVVAQ